MRRRLWRKLLLWLVAVTARRARRHPSELTDAETLEDVENLRTFLTRTRRRRAPELDPAVAETLASFYWSRYLYADPPGTADDLREAVWLWRRAAAVGVPPVLAPLFEIGPGPFPEDAGLLVTCVHDLFDLAAADERDWVALESAVTLARYAMALARSGHEIDRDTRAELARALQTLAWHTSDDDAWDQAVANARRALDRTPRDDPEVLRRVGVLGMALSGVAASRRDERVLREALRLLRPAVRRAAEGDPHRPFVVLSLLDAITVRLGWLEGGDLPVDGPSRLGTLLAMVPEGTPGREDTVADLATALWQRYLYLDGGVDLDVLPYTLSLYAQVYARDPDQVPPNLARVFDPDASLPEPGERSEGDLHTLVTCASDLYSYAEEDEDQRREAIGQAGVLARDALALAAELDTIEPDTRAELARVLLNTFYNGHDTALLEPTRRHARAALAATPPDHEERLARTGVLGGTLAEIADARDDDDALHEALALLRPAVFAAGRDHPGLKPAAAALVRALTLRLSRSSGVTGFAETSRDLRDLMDLLPDDHPDREDLEPVVLATEAHHLIYLGDLSGAASARAALDRAVARLAPGTESHDRFRLASATIAVSLGTMGEMLVPGPELARYREVFDSVTALDPLERATNLEVLCTYLMADADPAIHGPPASDPRLLDECVTLLNDGLATVPKRSAVHRDLRAQLGATLLRRYRATGDRDDLERATTLARDRWRELTGRRANPSEVGTARSELAHAMREQHLVTGTHNTYDEAMTLLRAGIADTEQTAVSRVVEAYAAGDLAVRTGRWRDAADVYASGVGLAARGAWRALRRPDRERQLTFWSGLANEAAATAILAGDPRRAVTMLEHGRAILFHQELDARGNGLRLRAERPDLAGRLDRVEEETERTTDPRRRRDLAVEWRGLLAEIRSQPGFEGFLRPPDAAALLPAEGRTAVLVNPADVGSHALLVSAGGIRVVPLPALTTAAVRERVTAFNQALADLTRPGGRPGAVETVTETLDWLWHTTAEPVLAALGHHETPPEKAEWPRIHWCPTWMLTFLPIHAAAARRPSAPGQSVLDRVVSSYTPSLNTLRDLGTRPQPAPERRSLLLVALPEAPGLPPIPGAHREAASLAGLGLPTAVLTGPDADRAAVSAAMREHAWAHFACHASHDLTDPSRSRLLLHDHAQDPFTVVEISRLRLSQAQFAYLSACDTARGGLRLPDEAIHVGGALQLAGYQHVIATLWAVSDTIAARMTTQVYRAMRTGDGHTLAPDTAALALHAATRALRRRYPHDPTLWAGYVHLGP
ncbi:CHAT domain-containing protein [Phytohabitans houttuyneae]|uniref:CHAT domain-containing protein n=1 Tax=Phytohabitans houttuyneae TaxID=1076126 RepID=A0A6V8KLZ6_9ACTN|nr:CHAT domain-containing protein [Phytohabitans houttuyneae]GFJ83451.1 hypothetical protein Phou_076310 [Phytohabitans houttuyneae]